VPHLATIVFRIFPLLNANSWLLCSSESCHSDVPNLATMQFRILPPLCTKSGSCAVQNLATLKWHIWLLCNSESCHTLNAKSGYYGVQKLATLNAKSGYYSVQKNLATVNLSVFPLFNTEYRYSSVQNLANIPFWIFLPLSSKSWYRQVQNLVAVQFRILLLFNCMNFNVLSFIWKSVSMFSIWIRED